MVVMMKQPRATSSFEHDEDRWQAVIDRDARANGAFVFAVKTTGVYCRPTCAARRALRENVEFHDTPRDAEKAGFRACKRCRPNESTPDRAHVDAISEACEIIQRADQAPNLDSLARAVGMSAFHFHRVFKAQTGLTPKAYAIATRRNRVRKTLSQSTSITSAIYGAGFNSNGRFYATSSKLLGMTPSNFRAGGEGATIQFAVGACTLGSILVAKSQLGICAIALGDDADALVRDLREQFCKATLVRADAAFERLFAKVIAFVERPAIGLDLPLQIQGTAFQQRVWKTLCEIPCGQTQSYTEIANRLGQPKAVRAVAHACAANQLAVAIPCHRVVRSDGSLSGYRWGIDRKAKLLANENASRTRK